MTTTASGAEPRPKYKRSLKNYLLDTRFQFKYTSMILAVALVISSVLGVFLWRTSNAVVAESKKVSEVVRMSIKDDPFYSESPELMKAYTSSADETDKKIMEQQQRMLYGLVGGLGLMCLLLGVMGIIVTHKVAGPIYKMKLLLRQVGDGKLNFHGKLRKGDELQDVFETFQDMTNKLKARQHGEVEQLAVALELARKSGASDDALARIESVLSEMRASLEL